VFGLYSIFFAAYHLSEWQDNRELKKYSRKDAGVSKAKAANSWKAIAILWAIVFLIVAFVLLLPTAG
jgi:hypothetical protein